MSVRRLFVVAAFLLALAVLGPLISPAAGGPQKINLQSDTSDSRIEVGPNNDSLWPYTSRSTAFEGRTLVLNAIIAEDPKTTRTILNDRAGTSWQVTDPEQQALGAPNDDSSLQVEPDWRQAHGSVRYTYANTGKGDDGQWVKQRYQLHVGTYFGTRHHIRAFAPSDDSEWTALQAHSEYWDWFRLRHTVTDIRGTATMLESDFQDLEKTTVERRYTEDSGPLSSGIVVVSGLVPLLIGFTQSPALSRLGEWLSRPSRPSQALVVFGLAAGIPLAVRAAGVGLELALPFVTPKLYVALLYPCLAIGLPVAIMRFGSELPAWLAVPAAAIGAAMAFSVEFMLLGVTPPSDIVQHRLLVATGLGLLAGIGGDRRTLFALTGGSLWLWGLYAPLFGSL